MPRLSARLERLEALGGSMSDAALVEAILSREADPTAWLLAPGGNATEKSGLWGHILKQVDGRSKGLPQERTVQ
ncbi:hypothetical protein GCM10017612_23910 [Novosphingobium resinovorum]|nr:hypothetical protein GCM10017612_23910 [Novosphingobium resinovorum]